eukprot:CAMPEP_0170598140 /NCGR_PEP_ID=MMETSP0224-20130122/16085_1 /TAXON_ID=285029 /ORGANISM="Togula jolla, Strain CCCM 725" /LENGTH=336 /DNA_ID=CAMNT_0010922665 /DNA_START=38 /DNA_END=1048 /DNA_ORIENTATION=+
MGQLASRSVPCCTLRSLDPPEEFQKQTNAPAQDKVSGRKAERKSFEARLSDVPGGDKQDDLGIEPPDSKRSRSRAKFDPLCSLICMSSGQDWDHLTPRQSLFGERALPPKQRRLEQLKVEVEALRLGQSRLVARLSSESGAKLMLSADAQASADVDGMALCLSDWVEKIAELEEAAKGLSVQWIKQACGNALEQPEGLVELRAVQEKYKAILSALQDLAQERIATIELELATLEVEVGQLEELIIIVFEKIDEEVEGAITGDRFVEYLCGEDNECRDASAAVTEEDARALFIQMSKGEELNFDRFKDEITQGCLHILLGNIRLRQALLKRYRDYWF